LAEALFRGLAKDGGLYVPEHVPSLDGLPPRDPELVSVAVWVARTLLSELPDDVARSVCGSSLDMDVPLVEIEPGIHVLELYHGPTHAFKDVGARFLARLGAALHPGGVRTVLVATSGDTGGAVADAFHGVDGFRVVVLFPRVGVSERQRRQMTTLGGNVTALSVDGSFDDCQRMVKEAFVDVDLSERFGLMSANSINIGRLLPQTFYYVQAAARHGWQRPVRFAVPSGNLGNLCAGLIASRMGMPHAGFVAAANANRGFVDFLHGRPFEARPSVRTASNAMDVGAPSNLERILFLYGNDDEALRADVVGASIRDDAAFACARQVHQRTGYLLDPHSAVAYEAALRRGAGPGAPTVVLATAHPAKFPEVTERVAGEALPLPPGLARSSESAEAVIAITAEARALHEVLEEVS
jgi:threonine synthase